MLKSQQKLSLSPYMDLYDRIIPKDNLLRKINGLIDFQFVYDELIEKYCLDNGRNATDPIRMFKYLLLKTIFDLSDVDIVERSKYDMSFKYFLGMAPEEDVINPSSLTKFRKQRLTDLNLLDLMIQKTVSLALEKGIIKSKSMIIDSTHTKARYNQLSPRVFLQQCSKKLRKAVYQIDETMKPKLPTKNAEDDLEKEIDYCERLIQRIKQEETLSAYPAVKEKLNLLEELLQDDKEQLALTSSTDPDAKTGHKTADTSFFGYKTHLAMTEERIITAATITSGDKTDGKELETLYEKSRQAGMEIDVVIGDSAYSETGNIKFAEKEGIKLVAKLNPCVSQGMRKKEDEFEFNKDAGMYQCKAGELAIKKYCQGKKNVPKSRSDNYYFDVSKCKICSYREGCYKEGAKTKVYSVRIQSDVHKAQMKFEKSDYFKEKSKERYKIEAKNSELKHRYGYDVASSSGLVGMELQGAMAIFTVNVKRILKLLE